MFRFSNGLPVFLKCYNLNFNGESVKESGKASSADYFSGAFREYILEEELGLFDMDDLRIF